MAKELSEDEIEVLCRMFIDEGRIKAGGLTDYMEYTLAQFRYLKAYLAEKYPQATFEFLGGDKQVLGISFATFKFREGGNDSEASSGEAEPKREFWANVYGNNDDKPATLITDNYYAVAAEEKYENYLKELLDSDFGDIFLVDVIIEEERGYGFDLNTTMDKYLAPSTSMYPRIKIYFSKDTVADEAKFDELVKGVEEFIRAHEISGTFAIATVENVGVNHKYTVHDYIYYAYFNNSHR